MMYDTMSVKEIEEVRNNFSKAKNSKAWAATPGEMYKRQFSVDYASSLTLISIPSRD